MSDNYPPSEEQLQALADRVFRLAARSRTFPASCVAFALKIRLGACETPTEDEWESTNVLLDIGELALDVRERLA